jgi:hypothetical protein
MFNVQPALGLMRYEVVYLRGCIRDVEMWPEWRGVMMLRKAAMSLWCSGILQQHFALIGKIMILLA